MPMDRIAESGGTDAAYLLKTGGTAVAEEVYRDLAPTPIWRIRFFLPGQQEEFSVSLDPRSAAGLGFQRTLPDDAPGASLEKPEALALAASFLKARGLDPAAGELKEQTQEDKKARRDHTLVWEFPIAGAGEAKLRHEVTVQGGAVGGWVRGVKIPEDWERDREKQTAVTIVLRYLKIPFLGVLAGLAVVLFIGKIRAREIPWKGALAGGLVAAVAMVILTANQFDRFWAMVYQTAVPKNAFMATLVVIFLVTAVLILLAGTLACALAAALYPGAARSLRGVPARLPARDALVAGVVGAGVAVGISALSRILDAALPAGRLITGVPWPESLGGNIPILSLGLGLLYRAIFLTTLGAIAVAVVRTWFRAPAARIALGALCVLAFLPGEAREPAEFLRSGLFLLIALVGTILVVRYFLGANPLSWVWCAWFIPGLFAAAEMLRLSAGAYRAAGVASLAILVLPGIWLLWGALAGPTRREEA